MPPPTTQSSPLPLATVRDVGRVAWTLARGLTHLRERPRPRGDVVLACIALPATLLITVLGIAGGRMFCARGIMLSISRLRSRRRQLAATAAWSVGLGVIASLAIRFTPVDAFETVLTVTGSILGLLWALVLGLLIGVAGLIAGGAERRQGRRGAGFTRSKRSRSGMTTPPPARPTWVINDLARHPRVRGVNAFLAARDTVVPSGAIVETLTASPELEKI